ncbi:MAG: GAF domain-containing protein [Phormidium sp. GEM2.Bin31]|nr:MAG: GAF domain-containing protein [Phormidium sp. GEM2.Bin31]
MDSLLQLQDFGYRVTKTLHRSPNSIVYSALEVGAGLDGPEVAIKLSNCAYPSVAQLAKLRNQYALAQELQGEGIVRPLALKTFDRGHFLVLENIHGISLADDCQGQPLPLGQFLAVSRRIVRVLENIHQQSVIHKDIKPSNLILEKETGKIYIADFSIASRLPRERQQLQSLGRLEGTLAYLSPEQTGRMNRSLDYRSDFYSLGVTFFELLTGQLPFPQTDAAELVYAHLARTPPPLRSLRPELPEALEAIVNKLMAKNPEDRYQSAGGLQRDLQHCQECWQKHPQEPIQFTIGRSDWSDRFVIPEVLYGREAEVQTLLDAFDHASQGNSCLILVAGYSGIGKTSLVNEVHRPIARKNGYFIQGKFDLLQGNSPLSGFVQAFRELVEQVAAAGPQELAAWRSRLRDRLGDHGGILLETLPELVDLIGEMPSEPDLSAMQRENRFNLAFGDFVRGAVAGDRPLVLFLDDLQWADSASLKLLERLLAESQNYPLLTIGTYRDHEVGPGHPLLLSLANIAKTSRIETLTLGPLNRDDVSRLTALTLHRDRSDSQPLADLLYDNSQGNPFFVNQLLKTLYERGAIAFNPDTGTWAYHLGLARTLALTDDVVQLLGQKLQQLPRPCQTLLQIAACIGNHVDLKTLATVAQQSPSEVARQLWPALEAELIIPANEASKFYQGADSGDEAIAEQASYLFRHDRIQQAAHTSIPPAQRPPLHHQIAQLLVQASPNPETGDRLFDIVHHYNTAWDNLQDDHERLQVIKLNLSAAQRAQAATAHAAALSYSQTALKLLDPYQPWTPPHSPRTTNLYQLTLTLHQLAAESAFAIGEFTVAEQLIKSAIEPAQDILDTIPLYEVWIQVHVARNNLNAAIHTGLHILGQLGLSLPESPDEQATEEVLEEILKHMKGNDVTALINLPLVDDPYKLASRRIALRIAASAYVARPNLHVLLNLKLLQQILTSGVCSASAYVFASFGILCCGLWGDYARGHDAKEVALGIIERFEAKEFVSKVELIGEALINHWHTPLIETLPGLLRGYQAGIDSGDFEFASYCLNHYCIHSLFSVRPLDEVAENFQQYQQVIAKLNQKTHLKYHAIGHQAVENLMSQSPSPLELVGPRYDERQELRQYQEAGETLLIFYLFLQKLYLACLFDDMDAAVSYCQQARPYLNSAIATYQFSLWFVYGSLAHFDASRRQGQDRENCPHWSEAITLKAQVESFAQASPTNHGPHLSLLQAEQARCQGEDLEAMAAYDRAIEQAQQSDVLYLEALANERAAGFYRQRQRHKIARTYITDAYYGYVRWGATAKVRQLEQLYRQELPSLGQVSPVPGHLSTTTHDTSGQTYGHHATLSPSHSIDFSALIEASQAISSAIDLDDLLSKLMAAVVEHSGAETATLLWRDEGDWVSAARYTLEGQCETGTHPLTEENTIPRLWLGRILRSGEPIVVADARCEAVFAGDVRFADPSSRQGRPPQSVLLLPLCDRTQTVGALYLENSLVAGAFTGDRVQILQTLGAQAMISLENARLYRQSQDYAQQLEGSLQDLKNLQLQLIQHEKMSALGNLVAGVAHEINNPIGCISANLQPARDYLQDVMGLLQLYQDCYPNPDPRIEEEIEAIELDYIQEDFPSLLTSMETGVKRIVAISRSLRTFSRHDGTSPSLFDLRESLDSTLLILKHRLKANEWRPAILVEKDYDENLPLIECFPSQLNQVFMNLIANAIDALDETNRDRSYADIQKQPNRIQVSARPVGEEHVQVCIEDNGCGMSEGVQEQAFEHLFTTKPVGEGTGLGLSIVQQILTTHQASMKVRSRLGQGTAFELNFPCHQDGKLET